MFIALLGIPVFAIGLANLLLVHPVPGLVFILLSLVYIPSTNIHLKINLNFTISPAIKIILAMVIFWFTLGVSELGDIIDGLFI